MKKLLVIFTVLAIASCSDNSFNGDELVIPNPKVLKVSTITKYVPQLGSKQTMVFTYNEKGYLTNIDEEGVERSFIYDEVNRLVGQDNYENGEVDDTYSYDGDKLVKGTYRSYFYDGNDIKIVDNEKNDYRTVTFTGKNFVEMYQSYNQSVINYTYDENPSFLRGTPLVIDFRTNNWATLEYHGFVNANNVLSADDADGFELAYEYNEQGYPEIIRGTHNSNPEYDFVWLIEYKYTPQI
jgi:hypothetical protein